MSLTNPYFRPRILFLFFIAVIGEGCCQFELADNEPAYAHLIGHRCIVTKPAMFPEGGPHWLPMLTTPTPYPLIELKPGTVLRVNHVETWAGPIDPVGESVFAVIENGPLKGMSVAVGSPAYLGSDSLSVICDDWYLGLTVEAGNSIRPYEQRDIGVIYTPREFDEAHRAALAH